jgi:hypothetical protein
VVDYVLRHGGSIPVEGEVIEEHVEAQASA